jgi:hypothetical protein
MRIHWLTFLLGNNVRLLIAGEEMKSIPGNGVVDGKENHEV